MSIDKTIRVGDMVRHDWTHKSPGGRSFTGYVKALSPNGAMVQVDWNSLGDAASPMSILKATDLTKLAR